MVTFLNNTRLLCKLNSVWSKTWATSVWRQVEFCITLICLEQQRFFSQKNMDSYLLVPPSNFPYSAYCGSTFTWEHFVIFFVTLHENDQAKARSSCSLEQTNSWAKPKMFCHQWFWK
ncbi:uncharacterized protein A4U43_C07F560 [Asparagus officinalis]|uniref:Uncharacterized protein n=1 Tax=Asparagus officinalis TaxID=4686 RepID=A0A5P1ED75_ASPOF|nr:uncharacterized protein A4U43_C07F560 [Asparagus officinalis]